FLRWSLRRRSIEDFALIQGLTIEEFTRQRSAPMAPIYERHPHATALLVSVWKLLSGGVDPRESELRVVLRKTNPGSEHA
ncbi:MAG: hypothetical protein QOH12_1391, partial [Solirubrobacteraceae bacterium]|nr:hypothetical protein [Solirubrobacteraceae bacterium]